MLILKQGYIEIESYHAETQSRRGLTGSSLNMSSENMKWWQSKEECKYNHQRCCLGLLNCVCCCHGEAQSRIHLFVLDGVTSGGANLYSTTSGWEKERGNGMKSGETNDIPRKVRTGAKYCRPPLPYPYHDSSRNLMYLASVRGKLNVCRGRGAVLRLGSSSSSSRTSVQGPASDTASWTLNALAALSNLPPLIVFTSSTPDHRYRGEAKQINLSLVIWPLLPNIAPLSLSLFIFYSYLWTPDTNPAQPMSMVKLYCPKSGAIQ